MIEAPMIIEAISMSPRYEISSTAASPRCQTPFLARAILSQ